MRQAGVALITAVVVVAIATVMAARIGTDAALDLRRTAGISARASAWQVGLGAEAWAAEILAEDKRSTSVDDTSENWAQPVLGLPLDGGTLEGGMEDMQGRFNLNSLLGADGAPDEVSIEQFRGLLVRLELDPAWAGRLVDWLDPDTLDSFPDGAEDGVYLGQLPPYRAANGPVTTPSELLALPGFTMEDYLRLRPYVSALPLGTRLNVCTASAVVLAAVLEGSTDFGDQEALARNREQGCFPTLEDVRVTLGEENFQRMSNRLAETSNWFRLVSVVTIGTSQLSLYSLLYRNQSGGVTTVLRSLGTD